MENVPSSVILLVLSVVCACFVGSFAICAYHTADHTGDIGLKSNAAVYSGIDAEKYGKYDGMELKGSGVIRTISLMSGDRISIQVQQRDGTYESFGYFVSGPETLNGNARQTTRTCEFGDAVTDSEERLENAKLSSRGSSTYIEPDRNYTARIIPNRNGTVVAIAFDTVY